MKRFPQTRPLIRFCLMLIALCISFSSSASFPESFQSTVTGEGDELYGDQFDLVADFTRFSNRGDNFRILVQQPGGDLVETEAPEVGVYLGTVRDRPGASAAAVRFADDTVYYRVVFEDGREWVGEGDVFETICERDENWVCRDIIATTWPGQVVASGGAGVSIHGVDVGIDLPYHWFNGVFGNDLSKALAMVEFSLMNTNVLYMREAGIMHRLGRIVIRADQANDPYALIREQVPDDCQDSVLPDHCAMLNELSNQWENILPATEDDMALVMNDTPGAGLAYLANIGEPRGYSSNDANSAGDFSRVFRHEGGHNWSLSHFDGGAPEGSTVNSGNLLARMSGPEQALVIALRNKNATYLDQLGILSAPIAPQAATDAFYVKNSGSTVIDVLDNDHDANAESLQLISVNAAAGLGLGGAMSVISGAGKGGRDLLKYEGPGLGVTDAIERFEYRIEDGSGLQSVGHAFVKVSHYEEGYTQDFNSFADGTTEFMDGSMTTDIGLIQLGKPEVAAGALRLIPEDGYQHRSFTIPQLDLDHGFTAGFRFKISASGTPADALTINFGSPVPSDQVEAKGGFELGLSIEINTFAIPGYTVRINNSDVDKGYVFEDQLVDAQWHDAIVSWQPTSGLDLTIDNTPIFDKLPTKGFNPDAADMLAFSAKSGGFLQEVLIDDISVSASTGVASARQFLQTNSNSANISRLHLVNSADVEQSFTGTLVNGDGVQLGNADVSLSQSAIPSKGRLVLTSSDIMTLFGAEAWSGPAMIEVKGTDDFVLMSKLRSPSGLVSNTNCVREDRVLNIEGIDSTNKTFARFINTSENSIEAVIGTLFDDTGAVIGNSDVVLLNNLLPGAQVWINRDQFIELVGATWNGEAMLEVQEYDGLKLLNLNYVNDETFFNFSCFEDTSSKTVYLQTTSTSANFSLTHIVNTSESEQQFFGTLYNADGTQLGAENQALSTGNVAAKGRLLLSSSDIELIFGISPWSGPAMLEVSGSSDFELMTKLKSPSGLISNTNCVRRDQVHNIDGFDSPDVTYVRFINTGDSPLLNITGTLYDSAGLVIGKGQRIIIEELPAKAQVWVNRTKLAELTGDSWQGEAMLEIQSAPDALRLLNLNFINGETFFNFSCYESSF